MALLSSSIHAHASGLALNEKFPFLEANLPENHQGYDVGNYYPYITEAYQAGYLGDKDILFSNEAQGKLYDWLQDKGDSQRLIVINIPAYKLYLFEKTPEAIERENSREETYIQPLMANLDGTPVDTAPVQHQSELSDYEMIWETKVVVGSKWHKTPLTPFEIVSLKYSPTWTPTNNIMKRNARTEDGQWNWKWIEGHRFELFDRSTREPVSFEESVDRPLNELLLIEPKGDQNSLGRIKFETTSTQSIYLHDTNEPWFFDSKNRARSSGCIRVEQPTKLASMLARKDESYISSNIQKDSTYWEAVKRTPVFFLYDNVEYKYQNGDDLHKLEDPYGYFDTFSKEVIEESDFYIKSE